MPFSRKHFIAVAGAGLASAAAPAAAAASAPERAPVFFHILEKSEYNHGLMFDTLTAGHPHKQVFQASTPAVVAPGIASLYIHMQNSMNAHEFSFGFGPNSLGTLGVLMGPAIAFALKDAMWKQYGFGKMFGLASTNVYYNASSNLDLRKSPDDPQSVYQDWSAQAVMHRGGKFMVCHNAMTAVAMIAAQKKGASPHAVLADFEANVLPGFQVVPAGVAAVQLAQQHGWTFFAIV